MVECGNDSRRIAGRVPFSQSQLSAALGNRCCGDPLILNSFLAGIRVDAHVSRWTDMTGTSLGGPRCSVVSLHLDSGSGALHGELSPAFKFPLLGLTRNLSPVDCAANRCMVEGSTTSTRETSVV